MWLYTQHAGFTLGNSLFGAFNLTKHAYFDKYSGYGIGFDTRRNFLLSDGIRFAQNIIIFGADMNSSVHVDNRKKDILKSDSLLPKKVLYLLQ